MALSYSGRQDLTLAVQEIARLAAAGHLAPAEVTPELIAAHLATRQLPPAWQQPDLVVRTSGEQRMSNFMCWEAAYSGGRVGCLAGRQAWVGGSEGAAGQRSSAAALQQQSTLPSVLMAWQPRGPQPPCHAAPAVPAELYFSDVMWPEFGERQLADALRDYAGRDRRFGGRLGGGGGGGNNHSTTQQQQ